MPECEHAAMLRETIALMQFLAVNRRDLADTETELAAHELTCPVCKLGDTGDATRPRP